MLQGNAPLMRFFCLLQFIQLFELERFYVFQIKLHEFIDAPE